MPEPIGVPPGSDAERRALAQQAMDRRLVKGIAWTGAAKWGTQVLSWASTLIVARLLTPDDYGLIGMAMVYLGFVQLINEIGVSAAIIQRRDLDASLIARLGGLAALAGVVFFLISLAVAAPLAGFFGEPAVRSIVIALSTTFLLGGLQVLPYSLLTRDLEFRRLAWIDAAEAIALTAVTLGAALLGFAYWSIVAGGIAAKLVGAAAALAARPHRLRWPADWSTLGPALRFGSNVVIGRIAWYAYSNADFAIVGRVLGKTALGAYTFGWTIASIPVDKVSALLGRVMFPVLASVQDDRAAVTRYFLRVTEGLALVTFPLSVGTALAADSLVSVVLGPRWTAAVEPLRILALYAAYRSIMTLFPHVLLALGDARRTMHLSVSAAIVLPLCFLGGTYWGTTGVALGWVFGYPLVTLPFLLRYVLRPLGIGAGTYARTLWPAFSATLVMALAIVGVRQLLADQATAPVTLLADVATGAAAYGAAVLLMHRDRVTALARAVREARR